MDAIEVLKAKLSAYPHVRYTDNGYKLDVHPHDRSGFTVSLQRLAPSEFLVSFEGWHEEFKSSEEALDCVAFGLSEECRLAISYRFGIQSKWAVESLVNGVWTWDSETGLLDPFFWLPARIEYRQNHLIKAQS